MAEDDGSCETFTEVYEVIRLPKLNEGPPTEGRRSLSFHCRGEPVVPVGGGSEVYRFRGRRWKRID